MSTDLESISPTPFLFARFCKSFKALTERLRCVSNIGKPYPNCGTGVRRVICNLRSQSSGYKLHIACLTLDPNLMK